MIFLDGGICRRYQEGNKKPQIFSEVSLKIPYFVKVVCFHSKLVYMYVYYIYISIYLWGWIGNGVSLLRSFRMDFGLWILVVNIQVWQRNLIETNLLLLGVVGCCWRSCFFFAIPRCSVTRGMWGMIGKNSLSQATWWNYWGTTKLKLSCQGPFP